MLTRFEVKNFKGFEKPIVLDMSARDYSFNQELVRNSIVNKAIIYGKNGIGKSSLGIALFDIILHLTDKERIPAQYLSNYLNLNHVNDPASFHYEFDFDGDSVIYEYEKLSPDFLLREKLVFNDKCLLNYHYFDGEKYICDDISEKLGTINLVDNKLSIIKYVYRNTPTNSIKGISLLVQFCEGMLWYRGLSEGNVYAGYTNGRSVLTEGIYTHGKVREFESFLKKNGVTYDLRFESVNGKHELFAIFKNEKEENKTPFISLASTGTSALTLFYYWQIDAFDKLSFLFIDEFDAFLHYESAEMLIKILNDYPNCQTILTTHNTYLMTNRITRPDCCFIMTENKICSLKNATKRELREGHNLEKLYTNGEFDE